MGLQNTNNSKVKYLKVTNGAIRETVTADTPHAKMREYEVVKTGEKKTVYELTYNLLSGKVKNVYFKENEYGSTFNLVIVDDGIDYVLQFNDTGSLATTIYKMMPNIDVSKEIEISVSQKADKTSIFINHGSQSVKWAFTKDNPNGKPEWEQIMVKGKPTWDNSKEIAFFKEKIIPAFIARLEKRGPVEIDINEEGNQLDNEFQEKVIEYSVTGDEIPF